MRIALINGSPKVGNSASARILGDLRSLLSDGQELLSIDIHKPMIKEEEVDKILKCDALAFAFPLYVDAIPSHLLSVLLELEHAFQGKMEDKVLVYCFVNCGFFESKQNSIAIEMMQNFARRAGLQFGQGVGLGAGGMLSSIAGVPMGHGPKKNYGTAMKIVARNIMSGLSGEALYPKMNFPRFLYKMEAHMEWRKAIKKNGLKRNEIHKTF